MSCLKNIVVMGLLFLVLNSVALSASDQKQQKANQKKEKKKTETTTRNICAVEQGESWQATTNKKGISVLFGPPGLGNGNPNPIGLPPGFQDIEVLYVSRCGWETSVSIFPGPTFGLRYFALPALYGAVGGGLIFSVNGYGPGVYSAVGVKIMRHWPVSIEFEFKQALGIGFSSTGTRIVSPYSIRMGVGLNW